MNRTERLELIDLAQRMRRRGLRIPFDKYMRDPEGWMAEARRLLAASKR